MSKVLAEERSQVEHLKPRYINIDNRGAPRQEWDVLARGIAVPGVYSLKVYPENGIKSPGDGKAVGPRAAS